MVQKIFRVGAVLQVRGKSRSGHYDDIGKGLYTRPVKIGRRASGWPESEVEALQNAAIRGATSDAISKLVRDLEAARNGS
jgi:prophage regulatory protein